MDDSFSPCLRRHPLPGVLKEKGVMVMIRSPLTARAVPAIRTRPQAAVHVQAAAPLSPVAALSGRRPRRPQGVLRYRKGVMLRRSPRLPRLLQRSQLAPPSRPRRRHAPGSSPRGQAAPAIEGRRSPPPFRFPAVRLSPLERSISQPRSQVRPLSGTSEGVRPLWNLSQGCAGPQGRLSASRWPDLAFGPGPH